jgi:hypothetical protein
MQITLRIRYSALSELKHQQSSMSTRSGDKVEMDDNVPAETAQFEAGKWPLSGGGFGHPDGRGTPGRSRLV